MNKQASKSNGQAVDLLPLDHLGRRKPPRFWTQESTIKILESYVRGDLSLAEANHELGGTASRKFSAANVIEYYARPIRRKLGIPRPMEIDVRPYTMTAAAQDAQQARFERDARTTVSEGGRLVIPALYRDALGIREGTEVVMSLTDGELRIRTLEEALRRARMLMRRYIPEGRSLADELIAERRREARGE